MNSWTIAGNVGRDAETLTAQSGTQVTKWSVATEYFDNGEKKTQWVNVTWFGDRAKKLAQYITKGSKVCVTGECRLREWTDQSGATRTSLELIARDVSLMGGGDRKEGGDGAAPPASRPPAQPRPPATQQPPAQKPAPGPQFPSGGGSDFGDDEIPF